MMNTEELARDIIQSRIIKGMIGPGSDKWGVPDEEEIISDYPLQRYFSSIIYPDKEPIKTIDAKDSSEAESEAVLEDTETNEESSERQEDDALPNQEIKRSHEAFVSQNNFFPSNIGLTVALDKAAEYIDVNFSFGIYYQPKQTEIKIKCTEEAYNSFFEEGFSYPLPWRDILKYENEFLSLERSLEGKQTKPERADGEYGQFDKFKEKNNLRKSGDINEYYAAKDYIYLLEKLISRVWKRKDFSIKAQIPIESTSTPISLDLGQEVYSKINVGYNVKVYSSNNVNYVKIQLVNLSEKQATNRFSIKNEMLNKKCLFQSNIKVHSGFILNFKEPSFSASIEDEDTKDLEAEEINFIYRNIQNYGIGHNCSVQWSSDGKIVETSFSPKQDIKTVINEFKDTTLDDCLNIKNLSIWGLPKEELIQNLNKFINQYKEWIEDQILKSGKLNKSEENIAKRIIDRQKENYERLERNLSLLNSETTFKAFQIANTAMYIQLIISNDKDFAGLEKELNENSKEVDFNSLAFFEHYQASERIGFTLKYRPFQLAFFLLNIEEIINPEVRKQRDSVDLIWFPTGGGKTEAYLAVTAFTIVYRRLMNTKGYEGTSVIMRYTLRLLTAQQFERASRLISALEFLRNQECLAADLKNEAITIGLWVGQAATPNTIENAKSLLKNMNGEAEKNRNSDPSQHNKFQVSSCSWCGTKLFSKRKKISGEEFWEYGFEEEKKIFKIFCLNSKCAFHKQLPIQVVDDVLYAKPPTLLFGTIDKFAILAWQKDANSFFKANSKDGLAPDLIIQDELHLLSGPLGSIAGFFEGTIEMLCTKNGVGPKIIASTATTRNTELQIKRLYGNRKVNIFPSSGIEYNDSYFTREDTDSKRRYIGFMPTGKTLIDTQLQLFAHLLVGRLEIFNNKVAKEIMDSYWTIVAYCNSLKDVGRLYNKVDDEITNFTSTLQHRLKELFQPFEDFTFNYYGIPNRTKELTSRVESTKIKTVLKEIEEKFSDSKIKSKEKYKQLSDVVDLVLATNMISVGIDISRLNIMLINRMPKNIAEYIQASSRVGRKSKGLVITLLNPNRAREKSYFEHFINFHQAFYQFVEPISITPFTENTNDKMLTTAFVAYIRNANPIMANEDGAKNFKKEFSEKFKEFFFYRFSSDKEILDYFDRKLSDLINNWEKRANLGTDLTYKKLLKRPSDQTEDKVDWATMQSMREIDTETYIEIKADF